MCPVKNAQKSSLGSHLGKLFFFFFFFFFFEAQINLCSSRKHAYIVLTPLGFREKKSDIFYISAQNIDCWYSLEPPHRGVLASNHNLYFEQKYENYQNFSSESFHFLVVKFSIYLNRRVFVMIWFVCIQEPEVSLCGQCIY